MGAIGILGVADRWQTDLAASDIDGSIVPGRHKVLTYSEIAEDDEQKVAAVRPGSSGFSADKPDLGSALFGFRPPPGDAPAIEARWDPATDRVHYIELNRAVLLGKTSLVGGEGSSRITLPLPDGSTVAMRVLRTEPLGPRRFVVVGDLEGREQSRAILAVNEGSVAGQISDPEKGEYQLRSLENENVDPSLGMLWKVDPAKLGECGGQVAARLDADSLNAMVADGGIPSLTGGTGDVASAADASDEIPVRLLFLYTTAVRQAYGVNQVRAQIDLTIAGINVDMANSQIPVRIELASAQEVALNEASVSYSATLTSLRGRTDGVLDQIHAMRDEYLADLVSLGIYAADTGGSAGIAYVIEEPQAYVNNYYGFSVVRFGSMNSGSVLSHELGHNFGCAHDRENSNSAGAYPYSYGYRFFALDTTGQTRQFRDIMAYAPGTRVSYFSNPRLVLSNLASGNAVMFLREPVALGIASGLPGEADNARTIKQTAFEVSNYRASPQIPYGAGTLVNVSTRAYVGTGSQQLIGGFVITGNADKTVLVRAAGPSLLPYGVADALENPVLQLYRQGESVPFAINDDWGDQPDAAQTTRAGFTFAVGSRDSALVRTLPPGGYTANIEGVGGTTGTALVEAYELDRIGDTKLINLSTRAYAQPDRPMIAGFVVNADPGSAGLTKRLLIRVLGPSLSRFNVGDLMSDPLMRLHDSKGTLLLENDDWDSPNTRLNDSPMLVRGAVDQYSEQMVFDAIKALGLIEMRPVEPAIVVDLPPGSYTVVVVPFEDLASNQPARPGIGLVEVYELVPR